ncbi:MAG TPA: YraN family protein [Anaerolineae bacterium]|jgi:putative endonuclease
MRPTRGEIGAWGEELAAQYLREHGYTIRDQNWRHGHGELDIVAERAGVVVFVEVRARSSDAYGTPEETLRAPKQAKLIETALAWLVEHDLTDTQWQIDVIAIDLDAYHGVRRLDHIEAAISQPSG